MVVDTSLLNGNVEASVCPANHASPGLRLDGERSTGTLDRFLTWRGAIHTRSSGLTPENDGIRRVLKVRLGAKIPI